MRKTLTLTTIAVVWLAHAAAQADTCSCTAPDGSCSASITCAGGCVALCRSGGSCSSECANGNGLKPFTPSSVQDEASERPIVSDLLPSRLADELISLDIRETSARELSSQLTKFLGRKIVFVPADPGELVSLQVKGFPASGLVEFFAKRGVIAVSGNDLSKNDSSGDLDLALRDTLSIQGKQLNATSLAALLSEVLQTRVTLEVENPTELINLEVKRMPVRALLRLVARLGDLSVEGLAPEIQQ